MEGSHDFELAQLCFSSMSLWTQKTSVKLSSRNTCSTPLSSSCLIAFSKPGVVSPDCELDSLHHCGLHASFLPCLAEAHPSAMQLVQEDFSRVALEAPRACSGPLRLSLRHVHFLFTFHFLPLDTYLLLRTRSAARARLSSAFTKAQPPLPANAR